MASSDKLDWIYKGANSLVDREDYLLGRKVDKTLEQLNEEEKDKKFVLPTPKNHVEHECIPPSIRDFNKIVQAEQVDLSAKLQEDPLVAIKKREEEARRQFLQNPIQLKKLQDALKKKESQGTKQKKKKKKHNDDLDARIKEKLKKLGPNSLGIGTSKKEMKKEKQGVLDIILMHKFNMFKDHLSEDDLKDILNGHVTDTSDEDDSSKTHKSDGSSDSESEKLEYRKKRNMSNDYYKRKRNSQSKSKEFEGKTWKSKDDSRTRNRSPHRTRDSKQRKDYRKTSHSETHLNSRTTEAKFEEKYKRRPRSRSPDAIKNNRSQSRDRKDLANSKNSDKRKRSRSRSKEMVENNKQRSSKKHGSSENQHSSKTWKLNEEKSSHGNSDDELDRKIMAQLKLLRGEAESKLKRPIYPEKPPDMSKQVDSSTSDDYSGSDKLKKSRLQYPENPKPLGRRRDSSGSNEKRPKKYTNKETPHLKRSRKPNSSSSSENEGTKYKYSDSEDEKQPTKSFGLVTSDGKKITLRNNEPRKIHARPNKKIDEPSKSVKKNVQKMTEEQKARLRREMMSNAKTRDKEREEYVKRYREKEKHEQEIVSKRYDADLVHTELLKSAKHSSVEQRIKSNLNNIQRSSRDMDQNFSKR